MFVCDIICKVSNETNSTEGSGTMRENERIKRLMEEVLALMEYTVPNPNIFGIGDLELLIQNNLPHYVKNFFAIATQYIKGELQDKSLPAFLDQAKQYYDRYCRSISQPAGEVAN